MKKHRENGKPLSFTKWFEKENAKDKLMMKIIGFQLQKAYEEGHSYYN